MKGPTMSTPSLFRPTRHVKYRRKFDPLENPDLATIQAVWRESVALERLATDGRDIGLALRRSHLLSHLPTHEIPAFLDAMEAAI